jgi:putative tryptophan/tyrosine transport system substrate-binding protein
MPQSKLLCTLLVLVGFIGETFASEQARQKIIGVLSVYSVEADNREIALLENALLAKGRVRGRDYRINYLGSNGEAEVIPQHAERLKREGAHVIYTTSNDAALGVLASKTTVPTVFSFYGDPVLAGLVASLAKPNSRFTGVSEYRDLHAKRFELLQTLFPATCSIAVVVDPHETDDFLWASFAAFDRRSCSANRRVKLVRFEANSLPVNKPIGIDAIYIPLHGTNIERAESIMKSVAKWNIPSMAEARSFVQTGATLALEVDRSFVMEKVASTIIQILDGATPEDIPVYQPTRWKLIGNTRSLAHFRYTTSTRGLRLIDEFVEK